MGCVAFVVVVVVVILMIMLLMMMIMMMMMMLTMVVIIAVAEGSRFVKYSSTQYNSYTLVRAYVRACAFKYVLLIATHLCNQMFTDCSKNL